MEQIHDRLAAEFKRLGLQGAKVAREIDLPSSQGLRDVFGGRKRLSAELLAALVPLGVDPLFVLTGSRLPPSGLPALTPRGMALLSNYEASDEEGRRVIEGAAHLAAKPAAARKAG